MSNPKTTIGHLRDLIRDLPDSAQVEITNLGGAEWYGIEPLHPGSVEIIDGKLVIDFGNSNQPITYAYRQQKRQDDADEIKRISSRIFNYVINFRKSEKYSDYPAPKAKDV